MDHSQHNRNVNFIWSIADDKLRDVYPIMPLPPDTQA
jgi:hypothetical protein